MSTFIRARVRAVLQIESNLHIGSGQIAQLAARVRQAAEHQLHAVHEHDSINMGDYKLPYQECTKADPDLTNPWISMVHCGIDPAGAASVAAIPGSSLRGLWRSAIARSATDQGQLSRWFGPAAGSTAPSAGMLRVADLTLSHPAPELGKEPWADQQRGTAVTHGIRIDPATGVVQEDFLWAYEYVPTGTRFKLELDVVAMGSGPEDYALKPIDDAELLALLESLTTLGQDGADALGRGRSKGMGRFRIPRQSVQIELLRPDQLSRLATTEQRWDSMALDTLTLPQKPALPPTNPHQRSLLLDLQFADGLLVNEAGRVLPARKSEAPELKTRNQGTAQEQARQAQLRAHALARHQFSRDRNGRPKVPGSTLKGALRGRCRRIVLTALCHRHPQRELASLAASADQAVDSLFGNTGHRSRVRVSDALWLRGQAPEQPQGTRQTRVAIDRFTGAVATGKLFDALVASSCTLRARIEVDWPLPGWQAGLLLFALRDGMEGDLHLGAGHSHGLGRFSARLVPGGIAELDDSLPGSAAELQAAVLASDMATGWLDAFAQFIADHHSTPSTAAASP